MAEKITMYVRPGCPDVARVRHYLTARGQQWDEVDIDRDAEAEAQVRQWTGRAATPTLWIGETLLVEPDASEIDAALAKV